MSRIGKIKNYWQPLAGFAIVAGVAFAGVQFMGASKAATTVPYGAANYCQFEGGNTVIYGWAADAQATTLPQPSVTVVIGGQSKTVPTDVAGYRDAAINAHIDSDYPGDPKPGTYGFRAVFSGLYKDTSYTISGTIINVGAGSNRYLAITTTNPVDGVNRNVFVNNKVPTACLATRPAPPPPPPAPSPTPSPTPRPTPRPSTPTPSPTPTPPPAPTADSNASVAAGTLAAQLIVPTGNATRIKIVYGSNPVQLDKTTSEVPANGDRTTIVLTNLDPSTGYTYQIVRSNDAGQTATSPVGTFTTHGFNVVVHLVDKKSKPVKGVTGTLANTKQKATSDKDGVLKFTNLKSGNYQLSLKYNDKEHKQTLIVNPAGVSAEEAEKPTTATADFFINVDNISSTTAPQSDDKASPVPWVLAGIGLLIVGAAIVIQRRRARAGGGNFDFGDFTGFELPGGSSDEEPDTAPPAEPAHHHAAPPGVHVPPPPAQPHMGESLKDMVIQGMQEEARKKHPPEK